MSLMVPMTGLAASVLKRRRLRSSGKAKAFLIMSYAGPSSVCWTHRKYRRAESAPFILSGYLVWVVMEGYAMSVDARAS